MTTTEHLNKIAAKCRKWIEFAKHSDSPFDKASVAAMRSTLAAIAAIEESLQTTVHWHSILKPMQKAIISAWPEELL
jgi:hypothetical protein